MGLTKKEKIQFLKISDGKLRIKTEKENPDAEERYVKATESYHYELVYNNCTGYLREIRTSEHEEYGTSYSLILLDVSDGTKYSLQMSENSRYFQSFVMHLPNIDFSKQLTVTPFSFKSGNNLNIGLSFKQDDVKVENYYKDWDDDKKVSTPKNGLEDFDFGAVKDDKDEIKILQIKLLKWLKSELKKQVKRLVEFVEKNKAPESTEKPETETPEKEKPAAKEKAEKSDKTKKAWKVTTDIYETEDGFCDEHDTPCTEDGFYFKKPTKDSLKSAEEVTVSEDDDLPF